MQLQFVHNATLRCCCYLWIIALHWQRDSVCNLCVRCRCPFPLASPPPPSLLLLALLVVLSTLYVYRHTRPACTVCKCNEQFILSLFLNACGHFVWVLADADDIYMHYRDLYVCLLYDSLFVANLFGVHPGLVWAYFHWLKTFSYDHETRNERNSFNLWRNCRRKHYFL